MKNNSQQEQICPFCEIAAQGDPDTREVYRDSHIVAFFPTEPATLGHTLIIPRRHAPNIWALTQDEAAHIGRASVLVAHAIQSAINPHGLNVIQSNGAAATQTVLHHHTHLVPRWENDTIGKIWPPETSYSERQKDDAWAQLKVEILKCLKL
jgi:histidine triad (HIT) family protein